MRPRPVLHETEAETKTDYCETETETKKVVSRSRWSGDLNTPSGCFINGPCNIIQVMLFYSQQKLTTVLTMKRFLSQPVKNSKLHNKKNNTDKSWQMFKIDSFLTWTVRLDRIPLLRCLRNRLSHALVPCNSQQHTKLSFGRAINYNYLIPESIS